MDTMFLDSDCLTSAYISPLVRYLQGEGYSAQQVLAGTVFEGLDDDQFPNMITLNDCEHIIRNTCSARDRSPLLLGMIVGLFGRSSALGHLGFIGSCSETIDEALKKSVQFSALLTPLIELEYEHEKDGQHVLLTATEKFPIPEEVYDLIYGLAAGSMHCAAYSLIGDQFFDYLNHTTVYLKADAKKFPDLLFLTGDRIKFEFGCKKNTISFCKALALRKLPNGNRSVLKTTIESSKKLLLENEQSTNPHKIVNDICAVLEQKNDSNIALQDVAEAFCMSPRTLRRHLSMANTSFGKIVLDRKMTKAKTHLTAQGLSIKEITYQLGYSDVSNFSIAFKKYFGESPAAFRNKSLA